MPHAEYEVKCPRSKAVIASSSGPFNRRAWEAAAIPAASPPTTTSRSAAIVRTVLRLRHRHVQDTLRANGRMRVPFPFPAPSRPLPATRTRARPR
ncbi:hypothetical protein GCM10010347_59990 [Streptomyces cirratus]|uniref:Uncharacterized protein n=1 Tax=Streptomyces cirratus TaxID=68187 RepID=A0ABQ3F3B9_9ACTN|nr:hypothetical protein GCM10010347_59990 [Streptomyces cirratus]